MTAAMVVAVAPGPLTRSNHHNAILAKGGEPLEGEMGARMRRRPQRSNVLMGVMVPRTPTTPPSCLRPMTLNCRSCPFSLCQE